MSEPGLRVTRHPPERGGRRALPLLCGGGCCCCCCCCLHTAGAFVGAAIGSIPVATCPADGGGGAGRSRRAPGVLSPAEQAVLAAFTLLWVADRGRRDGDLSEDAYDAVARRAREHVALAWEELFPGRVDEARTWLVRRVEMLAADGVLPAGSIGHFRRVLGPQAEAGEKPLATGEMAQLFRLHVFYQEVRAAAEAGAVPASYLPGVRARLYDQALAAARGLGVFAGDGRDGEFAPAVREGAQALLEDMAGTLPPPAVDALREALAGGVTFLGGGASEGEDPCGICGDPLHLLATVDCAACATPHHAACWRYNGRCATFACGSVTTRQSRADDAAPIEFDLSEGAARELDSSPQARTIGVFWMMAFGACLYSAFSLGPWSVLFLGPVPLFLAAAFTGAIVGRTLESGTDTARAQAARLATWIFLGSVIGFLANFTPGMARRLFF